MQVAAQAWKNSFLSQAPRPAESKRSLPARVRQGQVGRSRWRVPRETDRKRSSHPLPRATHSGVPALVCELWAEDQEVSARVQERAARRREPARTPAPRRTPVLEPWVSPEPAVFLWGGWPLQEPPPARTARQALPVELASRK